MPVRKVSNRGGNIIGKFPSLKMGRMIAFESLLERDFIYLLDYEEEVQWFEEQPLTIEYKCGGKKRHYTPDFHLIENGYDVLIECKPIKFVNSEENRRKSDAARNWCTQHGWTYRVVTDQQIRNGLYLANVKFLTRYARLSVDAKTRWRINRLMGSSQRHMRIESIVKAVAPEDQSMALITIMHMIFHHEIYALLEYAPISIQTQVFSCLEMRRGKSL